ncbi:MAG: hypothetical protein JWN03_4757 [Nocardia sp.]|nr:hypothetical protein [Nocardia sp.]
MNRTYEGSKLKTSATVIWDIVPSRQPAMPDIAPCRGLHARGRCNRRITVAVLAILTSAAAISGCTTTSSPAQSSSATSTTMPAPSSPGAGTPLPSGNGAGPTQPGPGDGSSQPGSGDGNPPPVTPASPESPAPPNHDIGTRTAQLELAPAIRDTDWWRRPQRPTDHRAAERRRQRTSTMATRPHPGRKNLRTEPIRLVRRTGWSRRPHPCIRHQQRRQHGHPDPYRAGNSRPPGNLGRSKRMVEPLGRRS